MRGGKEFLEFSLHLTIKSKTAYVIVFAFVFVFVFVLRRWLGAAGNSLNSLRIWGLKLKLQEFSLSGGAIKDFHSRSSKKKTRAPGDLSTLLAEPIMPGMCFINLLVLMSERLFCPHIDSWFMPCRFFPIKRYKHSGQNVWLYSIYGAHLWSMSTSTVYTVQPTNPCTACGNVYMCGHCRHSLCTEFTFNCFLCWVPGEVWVFCILGETQTKCKCYNPTINILRPRYFGALLICLYYVLLFEENWLIIILDPRYFGALLVLLLAVGIALNLLHGSRSAERTIIFCLFKKSLTMKICGQQ